MTTAILIVCLYIFVMACFTGIELIGKVRASLERLQNVTLIYVKGHAGIELNERADGLAVRAVQERASSGWQDA